MRRGKPRTSQLITRLVDIGVERLTQDADLDEPKSRSIMREIAHLLCSEYGGNEIYVPKDLELARDKRDEEIWRNFTGNNGWELASQYNLTERQVRFICAVMRKKAAKLNQMDLPGIDDE